MRSVSDKAKTIYLIILIIFISGFGLLWMDYIGLVDINRYVEQFKGEPASVLEKAGDEPSLIEREEFEKEKQKLEERVEELDKREAMITDAEKNLQLEKEKIREITKGLELEKKKFEKSRKQHAGYIKNVEVLADKIGNMPPEESVQIMVNWEDPLIIDVLRQMDANAEAAGTATITTYLITLMPKEKASRIMYLMTQL
jgi:flagellar protein FlbB